MRSRRHARWNWVTDSLRASDWTNLVTMLAAGGKGGGRGVSRLDESSKKGDPCLGERQLAVACLACAHEVEDPPLEVACVRVAAAWRVRMPMANLSEIRMYTEIFVFILPLPGIDSNFHELSTISMRTASLVMGTRGVSAEWHVAVIVACRCEISLLQCMSSSRCLRGHGSLYVWCTSSPSAGELSRTCVDTAKKEQAGARGQRAGALR